MNSFEVRIENPCGEDLSKMKPTQRGKFCSACQRDLVDFTKLPDQEIIKIFHQTNGDVCGWFRPDQLERPLAVQHEVSSPNYLKFAASMLLTMALGNSLAQDSTSTVSNDGIEFQEESPVITKPFLISGTVTDVVTGEALIMATVRIDSSTYGNTVDLEGNFSFELPKEYRDGEVTLRIAYLGYQDQIVKLAQDSLESGCQHLKIQMEPIHLDAAVIVVDSQRILGYPEATAGVPILHPREYPIEIRRVQKIKWWKFRKRIKSRKHSRIKHRV